MTTRRAPTPTATVPRRRADAQRNRDALLRAARAATDMHGRDISLADVALEAGLAIGTLYNHFPTRQHLLEAVFVDDTNDLRARAEELAEAPGSLDVLVGWLRLQLAFSERGRSMGAEVLSAKHTEGSEMHAANQAMQRAGAILLERAQAAGEVRPGIGIVEVLRLVYGIGMARDHASDPSDADRMFEIVIAGIAQSTPRLHPDETGGQVTAGGRIDWESDDDPQTSVVRRRRALRQPQLDRAGSRPSVGSR